MAAINIGSSHDNIYRIEDGRTMHWNHGSSSLLPGWYACPSSYLREFARRYCVRVESERVEDGVLRWTAVLPPQMPGLGGRVRDLDATGVASVAELADVIDRATGRQP